MRLEILLKNVDYEIVQGNLETDIKNISWDSRSVGRNSLFICVKNRNIDRHNFAMDAVRMGACGLVVEHEIGIVPEYITLIKVKDSKKAMAVIANNYHNEPSKRLKLVGITGTNGKTSTTYFISQMLEGLGKKCGIISTVENSVEGKKLKTEKINPTTPDAIELQASFSEMLENGVDYTVMEVTSSALDRDRVYMCDFDIGVFTNLTQDHLEEHGTMENYKKAKMKLFNMCRYGVINVDDRVSEEIIQNSTCQILTYGIDKNADIKAYNIDYSLNGVRFKLDYKGISKDVQLKVPGRFSVYNALAAVGVCILFGMTFEEILRGLECIKGIPGRFQTIPNESGILAVIDYAHSPDSLEKILTSVREISKGKVITVFGCGGDRDKTKRPIMGKIAGKLSDFCIITSDNPRKENAIDIINEIEKGMVETQCKYEKIENRRDAIFRALNIASKEDVVVIAGKGHENYQIIGEKTIHFDDNEVVKEYFTIGHEQDVYPGVLG